MIIAGGGGHAKVLADALLCLGAKVLGVADPGLATAPAGVFFDLPLLGGDEAILGFGPGRVVLVNGLGSLPGSSRRRDFFKRFSQAGYRFATVVHPSAVLGRGVQLGDGAQIMAGAVIQADVCIGENTIINTGASIDHDCRIGKDVHVAPGATLSGHVEIEDEVHIGTGAAIIHRLRIEKAAVIGAGATIVRDVKNAVTVIPATVRTRR